MSSHYHAIVWIDHHEARVFHFNVSEVDRLVLHPDNPTHHLHHKANTIGSGHGAVLVTGPANAKTELVKHIRQHVPKLSAKIAGIETVDHPTDGELVAHARKYFKADHQMPPRIR